MPVCQNTQRRAAHGALTVSISFADEAQAESVDR
jgi:hypothetical protein